MANNPYTPSEHFGPALLPSTNLYWRFIAFAYAAPLIIGIPMCFESGWYGIGIVGATARMFQVAVFLVGSYCAWRTIIFGTNVQRFVVLPAVLGYTGLVVGIYIDHYL